MAAACWRPEVRFRTTSGPRSVDSTSLCKSYIPLSLAVFELGSFPLGTFIFIVGSSEIRTYERLSSLLPDRPSSVKSNQQLRDRHRALVTSLLLSVWAEIEDRWQVVEISRSSSMQSYDLRTLASRRTRASDIPISTSYFHEPAPLPPTQS